MEKGFDGTAAHNPKRSHAEMEADNKANREHRQRQWLSRNSLGTTFGTWRLKQVYRTKAKWWMMTLDNQFRGATGRLGLVFSSQETMHRSVGPPLSFG